MVFPQLKTFRQKLKSFQLGPKAKSFRLTLKRRWRAFLNQLQLALVSTRGILAKPSYAVLCAATFLLSLFFFTCFKDGAGTWQLLFVVRSEQKLSLLAQLIQESFKNFVSLSGLVLVLLAFLQALVLTQLVFALRSFIKGNKQREAVKDGASSGFVGAIFAFLSFGCPSCGLSLLMPLASALLGTAAASAVELLGAVFLILAFLALSFSILRLSYINFMHLTLQKGGKS